MSQITKIIAATAAAAVLAGGIGACGVTSATAEKLAHEHPIKALHAEFDKLAHDHPIKAAETELRLEMPQWGVREATRPPCQRIAISAAPNVK
jgi:hypothetical protein